MEVSDAKLGRLQMFLRKACKKGPDFVKTFTAF